MRVELLGIKKWKVVSDSGVVHLIVRKEGVGPNKQCWISHIELRGWVEGHYLARLIREVAMECYAGRLDSYIGGGEVGVE